jgi:hypothetical protein
MGDCRYCGKAAGIFRARHSECADKHELALRRLSEVVRESAVGRASADDVEQAVDSAKSAFAKEAEIRRELVAGWEGAVDQFLEDDVLEETEEKQLVAFQQSYRLTQEELDENGAYSRIEKSAVLRELVNGTIPEGVRVEGILPFNFQKGEQTVWVFPNVEYLEDRTRREYVGGSHGVSVRIAKGVYYRTSSFRGHPVERTERTLVDEGILAVTNKHIYFGGPRKSFRIRHDKIVTHMPFTDGVGVVRDALTAKPQVFVTGDGWFSYNLLVNLARL